MYFPFRWFFCIHYYDFHIKIQILFTWVVWLALSVSNFKMECSEMQTEMKILVTVFCFFNLIWVKTFGMILKNYTKSTLVTFTEYRHLKSIDLIGKNTDNVMLSLIKTTWTKKVFFFCFCQVWHSNGLFIVTKTSLKIVSNWHREMHLNCNLRHKNKNNWENAWRHHFLGSLTQFFYFVTYTCVCIYYLCCQYSNELYIACLSVLTCFLTLILSSI